MCSLTLELVDRVLPVLACYFRCEDAFQLLVWIHRYQDGRADHRIDVLLCEPLPDRVQQGTFIELTQVEEVAHALQAARMHLDGWLVDRVVFVVDQALDMELVANVLDQLACKSK